MSAEVVRKLVNSVTRGWICRETSVALPIR